MNIQLTLAGRYLWGRKLRTALTTLAIVFGALIIFSMNTMLPTMERAFQVNMMAAAGQVDVTVSHDTGEAFSASTLHRIQGIAGIRAIAGSLSRTVNIPAGYYGKAKVSALTLTGIEPGAAESLRSYRVTAGRFLRSGDTRDAVISESLADTLALQVGDKLSLPTTEGAAALRIVGLLPARTLPGNEEVLVTLHQAQAWFELPNRINTIEINLESTDEAEREAVQGQIAAALGPDYTLGALSGGSELLASMRMGQIAFSLFGFLALAMGGFIILNTFRTLVAERRRDIGMLRALGASRRTIVGLILAEGLLQGLAGTLIGMALGYLLSLALGSLMGPMINQFVHLEMGLPVVSAGLVAITLALGIGVTLLSGLIPALQASRVTPLEALRPSGGESKPRVKRVRTGVGTALVILAIWALLSGQTGLTAVGGLLFLVGMVLATPALVEPVAALMSRLLTLTLAREGTGTLAQVNVTRQPGRSAITASATMIGLAVIVGMGGMVWSLSGGFLSLLRRSLGSDYLIMPPAVAVWGSDVGAKGAMAQALRDAPGVEVVSTMRYAAATVNGQTVSLLGIDPQTYPQVASLGFQHGDPQTAYRALAQERALIANGILAAQAGLKVGDVVRVSTPTGAKDYRIAAVAGDFLNAKVLTAYVSQENLARDWRKSEDIFVQVNLAQGADVARAEAKMRAILEDYPQFRLVNGQVYYEENAQLFKAAFAVYFVILGVLAFPSLIAILNTLTIGVIERTREIGMLRAIGAERRQVRRMVVAESLLLAAIGTALGLVGGLYLGYVLVAGMSLGGFPISYVFPYAGLAAALAAGLAFGVLAALVPARQAAQMDIIRALRYE